MPSNYPDGLDVFTAPGANLGTVGAEHSDLHNELKDALAAVQATLGTNPEGGSADVAARVTAHEDAWPLNTAGSVAHNRLDQANIWNPLHQQWNDWTGQANPGGFSTGVGAFRVFYKRIGAKCDVRAVWDFGAGSAVSASVRFLVPFAPLQDAAGSVVFLNPGSAPIGGSQCYVQESDSRVFVIWEANPSNVWDSAGPLNAGNIDGARVALSITYETASVNVGTLN